MSRYIELSTLLPLGHEITPRANETLLIDSGEYIRQKETTALKIYVYPQAVIWLHLIQSILEFLFPFEIFRVRKNVLDMVINKMAWRKNNDVNNLNS